MYDSSAEIYSLSPCFLWGKIQNPYCHIGNLSARLPAHLLVSFPPSCLPPPGLDHYFLSLHIFAQDSPSAWISLFPCVFLANACSPHRLSHSIASLGAERDCSRPCSSFPSLKAPLHCNQQFLYRSPTLSLELLQSRVWSLHCTLFQQIC